MSIKIKHPKAKKLLENLAALDLIEISQKGKAGSSAGRKAVEKTVTHLASEKSLAKTWNTAKEDKAWQDL